MFDFFKKKKGNSELDEVSETLNEEVEKKDPNILNVKLKILSLDIFHEAYNIFLILEYNKKDKLIVDPSTNKSRLAVIKGNGELINEKEITSYEELSKLVDNRIDFHNKLSIYAVKDLGQIVSIKQIMDGLNDQSLELNMLNYDGEKDIRVPTSQQGIAYIKYNLDYSDFCDDNFISDEEVVNSNIIGSIPYDKIGHYDFNVNYTFNYEKGTDEELDKFIEELLKNNKIEYLDNNPNRFRVLETFFSNSEGITFIESY